MGLVCAGGVAGFPGCSALSRTGSTGSAQDKNPGTETQSKSSKQTATLQKSATIGVNSEVASSPDYADMAFYTRAFEPLTYTTPNLRVKPWLAEDWERTGKMTWEFTLRNDVQYHNGDPLTADRVVSMFEWSLLYYYAGMIASPRWANTTADGVRVVDERTIEMETIEATVNQPANLAIITLVGAHPDSSGHTDDPATQGDFSNLIGTGPFQIESVDKGNHVKLSAFDGYWGGAPHMETLTVGQYDDRNTLALALKGNEIDVGVELPANQLEQVENASQTETVTQAAPKTAKVRFNMAKAPFDDRALRKALNFAIPQKTVVKATQNGLGTPARGPLPPMIWFSAYDDLPRYGPDKAKAKRLVDQSEYDGGTLQLLTQGEQPRGVRLIASFLEQELAKIGVDVEIQTMGINAYVERRREGEGHLFLGENTLAAPDEAFLESLVNVVSQPLPVNEIEENVEQRLTDLFDTARTNTGEAKKAALLEAQRIYMDEALILPLYHEKYLVGMRTGIEGVDWHPVSGWTHTENLKYMK